MIEPTAGLPFDNGRGLREVSNMQKIIREVRKLKANSFTLVELLVVISIIGLLAGLAVPAIQGGLDKAKQQVDVSNIRQSGLILFTDATDNNGSFSTNANSTLGIFQDLITRQLLNSTKILSGNGYPAATSTNNLTAENIAWAYVSGLTTSDSGQIPLLLSKGVSQLADNVSLGSITKGWKQKGLVVYRVGGSSEFLKSGTGGAAVGSVNLGLGETSVTNPIYQN